jgi:hypothetical protein
MAYVMGIDLFHQVVYEDDGFVIVADLSPIFIQYDVYEKDTGDWVGCTNCEFYMPQCRGIIKNRLQWRETTRKRIANFLLIHEL